MSEQDCDVAGGCLASPYSEEAASLFERIVNEANDAIIVAELNPGAQTGFRIVFSNDAFSRTFGYSQDQIIGRSPRILQGPGTSAAVIEDINRAVHCGGAIRRRILNYRQDGQPVWVDANIVPLPSPDGRILRFAAIERDITAEVANEQILEKLAFDDPLTKLGNRRYFDQAIAREISRSSRSLQPLSLAILDIDHFKAVNDTWGHPVGDRLLVAVGEAILQSIRAYDCAARIGGEEFAVLLPATKPSDGVLVVERICAAIRTHARVETGAQTIAVTCSAGVTSWGETADTAVDLMQRADRALYLAKNGGRNRVVALDGEGGPQGASGNRDVAHAEASA
jgi:diguanylate cyclase (GGDEF)-like protein/PAS domain S-box-containing protein